MDQLRESLPKDAQPTGIKIKGCKTTGGRDRYFTEYYWLSYDSLGGKWVVWGIRKYWEPVERKTDVDGKPDKKPDLEKMLVQIWHRDIRDSDCRLLHIEAENGYPHELELERKLRESLQG